PAKQPLPGTAKPPETASFTVEAITAGADPAALRATLDRRVLAGEIDAWLWISPAGLDQNQVEYHAESVSNFITQGRLEHVLSELVSEARLTQAGLDPARVTPLTRDVELTTVRVSKEGSRKEASMAGFMLAYFLFFLLYMVVTIYGQQVMNGVLEEKNTRIVEVLLAIVKPVELMVGKLAGIGLAGLTQLAVWMATMLVLSAPGVLGAMALGGGFQIPSVTAAVAVHFLLLFLLGFFFYSSLYAAIGAATNNAQEAQQFSGIVIPFLVGPVLLMLPVINDPNSTLSTVLSLIPPFTPLLMMLRIAVKMPPLWQILAGYVLTAGFVAFLVWLCARIYRIGILMYGKKPTFAELWRWIRYA
ncbi:MAG: ABC transporter permease, partial [Thermoanaerobaculia bacterium]|nr:ABC transporter permease [Thermoanaerobaculia bacterium]